MEPHTGRTVADTRLAPEDLGPLWEEHWPDVYFRLDPQLRYRQLSPNVTRMIGTPVTAFLGKTGLQAGMPAELWSSLEAACRAAIASGEPQRHEGAYPLPQGIRWLETRIIPEKAADGSLLGLLGISCDITHHKQTELALREREHSLRTYITRSPLGIVVVDARGRLLEVNPALCQIAGYSEAELLGRSGYEFLTASSRDLLDQRFAEAFQTGHADGELVFYHKDGSERRVSFEAVVLGPDRFLALCEDVTERRRAEETLRRSEERYRLLAQRMPCLLMVSQQGLLALVNATASRLLGYAAEELLGTPSLNLIHPDLRPMMREHLERAERGEDNELVALKMLHKNGATVLLECRSVPVQFQGQSAAIIMGLDITERTRVEQQVRLLAELLDTSPTATTVFDAQGRVLYANQKTFQLHGDLPQGVLSIAMHSPDAPANVRRMAAKMEAMLKTGEASFEVEHQGQQGAAVALRVDAKRTRWADQEVTLCVASDISELKQAERALRESEQRYRGVVENQAELICRFLPGGILTFVNDVLCRYFGRSREELLGRSFFPLLSRQELDEVQQLLARISLADPVQNSEIQSHDALGRPSWLQWSHCGIFDERGQLIEYQAVGRDITERRQAEAERLEMERRLLHAQKLESLGVLAGGIAHDFNNLLSAMMSNLDLALLDLPAGASLRTNLEVALQAGRRAADLTRQMLAYAGKGCFFLTEVDLSGLIEENLHLLRACVTKNVSLELQLTPRLPLVTADPGQIQQVILNLLANAAEAIGDQPGRIVLRTGEGSYDDHQLAASCLASKPPAGHFAFVEIRDTGNGMDAATRGRIFEPFFTTKFAGRGLGMSAVQGILQTHHGTIFVDSQLGQGTTVRALFPVASCLGVASPAKPASAPVRPPHRGASRFTSLRGTVLIVDDEEIVRKSCVALAASLGLKTLAACDGEEAVRIYQEQAERIDCVILDLTMPKKDGLATFREMRAINPAVKVVLVSGYGATEADRRFSGEGIVAFLQKPHGVQALTNILQNVLSSPPSKEAGTTETRPR